jgi:hypothetical protein
MMLYVALPVSDDGGYTREYTASEASHMSYTPDASPFSDPISQEPYPAWSSERQIPLSTEEVEDIFFDLQQKFGFQRDSMRNMVSSHNVLHSSERALTSSPYSLTSS